MSIDDAKKILSGSSSAATDYFRTNTTHDLQAMIAPIIQKSIRDNPLLQNNELLEKVFSVFK